MTNKQTALSTVTLAVTVKLTTELTLAVDYQLPLPVDTKLAATTAVYRTGLAAVFLM